MAELPSLPLFIDDYEAATAHLSIEEDGAYMRLLRLCWRQPDCSIPADDAWITRRMRCDAGTYERVVKPVLTEFFTRSRSRWFQKRLREERAYVSALSDARKTSGQKGGNAKARKTNKLVASKAKDLPEQNDSKKVAPTPTPTPIEEEIHGDGSARARDADPPRSLPPDLTLRERILDACGLSDLAGGFTGHGSARLGTGADMLEATRWHADLGLTDDEVVAVVAEVIAAKRDGPPSNFRYFRQSMQRLAAAKAQAAIPIPSQEEPHAVERHQHPRQPANRGHTGRGGAVENMLAGFAEAARSGPGSDP